MRFYLGQKDMAGLKLTGKGRRLDGWTELRLGHLWWPDGNGAKCF